MKKYVIGVDFGSDSVRTVIVDSTDGKEISSVVTAYPRWSRGEFCSPKENRYRQHPLDYIEAFTESVREALKAADNSQVAVSSGIGNGSDGYCGISAQVAGIAFDTTASTPVLVDGEGTPLALTAGFADEPDAMFVLWKDHTAVAEADEINALAHGWEVDYTKYCGGSYSCEWGWAKVLHIIRTNPRVAAAAVSWVEHADWMSALLTGRTGLGEIVRNRCVAGHKAMWNAEWGGYPPVEFFSALSPKLGAMRATFNDGTVTADTKVGTLTREWAERLGLEDGIAVGTGMIDCHAGAVGAGIDDNVMVKVIGTSTCDIIVAPYDSVGDRTVHGICGQVDGSVIPGRLGFEAGQSAFGDAYAWFRRLLMWPVENILLSATVWPAATSGDEVIDDRQNGNSGLLHDLESRILPELARIAAELPLTENDPIATDWFNGRRTPDLDPHRRASITELTLGTTAPEIYKAIVEATAFGSRAILERFREEGVRIDSVIAAGGISRKSPFVMQTLADVMGVPIHVADSGQACALGAAMYASVVSGLHPDIRSAQRLMCHGIISSYTSSPDRHEIYNRLYARYQEQP